jgi:hypothetical protein
LAIQELCITVTAPCVCFCHKQLQTVCPMEASDACHGCRT